MALVSQNTFYKFNDHSWIHPHLSMFVLYISPEGPVPLTIFPGRVALAGFQYDSPLWPPVADSDSRFLIRAFNQITFLQSSSNPSFGHRTCWVSDSLRSAELSVTVTISWLLTSRGIFLCFRLAKHNYFFCVWGFNLLLWGSIFNVYIFYNKIVKYFSNCEFMLLFSSNICSFLSSLSFSSQSLFLKTIFSFLWYSTVYTTSTILFLFLFLPFPLYSLV